MKKVFLLAAAGLLTTAAFSQVRFGPQAAVNFSSASMDKDETEGMKKSMKPGFSVGVASEIQLSKSLTLRPSLNYMQKGVKMEGSGQTELGSYSGEMKVYMNYLELPVVLAYNITTPGSRIYFGAGPSVGYGISGKSKANFTVTFPGFPSETQSEEADTFKKEEEDGAGFKRLDVSANVIAGVQFNNGLFINAGGLFGLNNIGAEDSKYRNIGGQLTVGFLLNNRK